MTAMSWLLRQGLSRPIYQNPMQEGCRVMYREKNNVQGTAKLTRELPIEGVLWME